MQVFARPVAGAVPAAKLTDHLLREIVVRESREGGTWREAQGAAPPRDDGPGAPTRTRYMSMRSGTDVDTTPRRGT